MGLPQADADPPASATTPQAAQAQGQSRQVPASSLPPAAIQLASKLFDMAREGRTAALEQYIGSGIPANLTNHKGDTLLMLAAYHGHAATTAMLLRRGADADALNDRGQSVIAGAVFKGYDDVVELLFRGVDGGRGADVSKGQPSAVDAAKMFKREAYLSLFGVVNDGVPPWENAS